MRGHISTCFNLLEKENIVYDQVRWEYLKYAVRKFSIKCSKHKERSSKRVFHEKIKNKNLQNKILKRKKEKKSSKIFLKVLFKVRFEQIVITTKKLLIKQKLIILSIFYHICSFFKYFYKETLSFSNANLETYLNAILFLKLTQKR